MNARSFSAMAIVLLALIGCENGSGPGPVVNECTGLPQLVPSSIPLLHKGQTVQIHAATSCKSEPSLKWRTSNMSAATVSPDSGINTTVTARGGGTALISVFWPADTTYRASTTVSVTDSVVVAAVIAKHQSNNRVQLTR